MTKNDEHKDKNDTNNKTKTHHTCQKITDPGKKNGSGQKNGSGKKNGSSDGKTKSEDHQKRGG